MNEKRNSKRWIIWAVLIVILLLMLAFCSRTVSFFQKEIALSNAAATAGAERAPEVVGQVTEESEEPATQPTVGPGVVEVIGTSTPEPTQALAGRITVLEPENGSALFYPNYDFTFRVEGVSTGEYGIWIAGMGESMSTITAFPPCIPGATEVCRADGDVVYYHSSIYWGLCGRHPNGSLICEETFGLDEVYHLNAHLLWLDPNCTEWIQEYREDRFNFREECSIRLDQADIVLGSED